MKAAILALALSLNGVNALSPKQDVRIDGQYCGRLWSNGALVQTITQFKTESGGRLTGTYQFADVGAMTSGTLNEAAAGRGLDHTLGLTRTGCKRGKTAFRPCAAGQTGREQQNQGGGEG